MTVPRQRDRTVAVLGVNLLAVTALTGYLIWSSYMNAPVGTVRSDGLPDSLALAVGVSFLLLVLISLVYRLWAGLRRTERQLREAVTAKSRAIAELAMNEANLRALSENATLGILVIEEGRFVFANSRAERWLGYSSEELQKIPFKDLIHPDDQAMLVDRYRRRLAGEDVPNQ
jgi:PAS domain-containing protein